MPPVPHVIADYVYYRFHREHFTLRRQPRPSILTVHSRRRGIRVHDAQNTQYEIIEPQVAAEAALDGLYVIRTGLPKKQMSAPDAVRSYKALAQVERAFRALKTVDLKIRPIHHRLESRVRAHIFLCMLAYYVEWHLIEAWRPLLFADEDRAPRRPAIRSHRLSAPRRRSTKSTPTPPQAARQPTVCAPSSQSLPPSCATPRTPAAEHPATFDILTTPTALQRRAFELIETIAA